MYTLESKGKYVYRELKWGEDPPELIQFILKTDLDN